MALGCFPCLRLRSSVGRAPRVSSLLSAKSLAEHNAREPLQDPEVFIRMFLEKLNEMDEPWNDPCDAGLETESQVRRQEEQPEVAKLSWRETAGLMETPWVECDEARKRADLEDQGGAQAPASHERQREPQLHTLLPLWPEALLKQHEHPHVSPPLCFAKADV